MAQISAAGIQTAECRVLSDCASMVCGIVWMTITFAVPDSKTGISVTGGELTMYKIAVFVLLFGMTMWFGNYLNIRRKLPGMKKINVLSTILTFGYAFTISFMFLAFFAIFMAIIGYL